MVYIAIVVCAMVVFCLAVITAFSIIDEIKETKRHEILIKNGYYRDTTGETDYYVNSKYHVIPHYEMMKGTVEEFCAKYNLSR